MKYFFSFALLSIFSLFPACFNKANCQTRDIGTYRTHNQLIEIFKDVCDNYPAHTSYEVIGKTTLSNDIWVYKIGNPNGRKIIIDGCIHGWEDLGSEVTFLWIKWLLESNEPKAKEILQNICWMVIPVINFDTYNRGNMNHEVCTGGVDLNRNFLKNWAYVPACEGPFGTSQGASAGSEKETQVMRAFLDANKPSPGEKSIYINTHYGGGPWIHYNSDNVSDFYASVRDKTISLWDSKGIILKNVTIDKFIPDSSRPAAPGGISGDASDFGYEAFTVEIATHFCRDGHKFSPIDVPCGGGKGTLNPAYELLQNELYPIWKQFFLAVSESMIHVNTPLSK
jgi:hypothetical protein